MHQEKKNLTQITADRLRNLIIEKKEYKPGEKLPNENIISKNMGISRATLREAVKMLVSEGILDVQRGRGTFVTNTLNRFAKGEIGLNQLSDIKVTLRDLYETRMIFEPKAAGLACLRAEDDEIEQILRLGEKCQEFILKDPTGKDRIKSENEFHGALIKASHNQFISSFMPVITQTIEKTFALNYNLDTIAKDAYKDHILIMEFLKVRDKEALESAITIHLRHVFWTEELLVNNK